MSQRGATVESWGRVCRQPHQLAALRTAADAALFVRESAPGIAFGAGRSYGDAALNPGGTVWLATALDRFVSFEPDTGVLVCEGGALLRDIQRLMAPRGWTLQVTPGTLMVTVGGAIANDVHGKNHHLAGSFGHHVRRLRLARTDGSLTWISADEHPALFAATVGGVGLTGVIVEAELQLERSHSPCLDADTRVFGSLDEFFELSDAAEREQRVYTVAWVDCLAARGGRDVRGVFFQADPAAEAGNACTPPSPHTYSLPFVPPVSLVNQASLGWLNAAYYHLHRARVGRQTLHRDPFLYPLDALHHWNRIYGPRGFHQYQCALPRASGAAAVREMLGAIADSGQGSFLTTLKTLGPRPSLGVLSFPIPGVTLALDFPERGPTTEKLFERLDAIVVAAQGRLYLAKDGRQPRSVFQAGYPRWEELAAQRDPGISSSMSRRLLGW